VNESPANPAPDLVDTHAHLDDERFGQDLPQVLERAAAAGVRQVVTIGTTAATSRAAVRLAAEHAAVFAAVGIQPNHAAEAAPADWGEVAALAEAAKVVAVGETGLDRHWDFTPFAVQEDYFARHLGLARRLGLPVVIHCREAEDDVVRMLRDDCDRHGPLRGVMHSFTGGAAAAAACLEVGLHLSFAGMLTYKSAGALRDVARSVPRGRVLVETDSPYLAPAPLRGRRNEPAFVAHTARCLAGLLGTDLARLAEQTSRNARELFRLPPPA
jgi:TatD DNase family protein